MPAVETSEPFQVTCKYCSEKAVRARKRVINEDGYQRYAGEFFSCKCGSLTVGFSKAGKVKVNQTAREAEALGGR